MTKFVEQTFFLDRSELLSPPTDEAYSDITLVVGSECKTRIPAHKLVLATASEVFHAMFYGSFTTANEVEIVDLEPEVLTAVLQDIYKDEIALAAKKYILPRLISKCTEFINRNLTAKNACLLYFAAKRFDEENLMLKCLEAIDAQGDEALNRRWVARTCDLLLSSRGHKSGNRPMVPSVCVDGFTAERDATVDAFYPMLQCLNAAGKLCWYLDPMEAQRLSFIQRNNK